MTDLERAVLRAVCEATGGKCSCVPLEEKYVCGWQLRQMRAVLAVLPPPLGDPSEADVEDMAAQLRSVAMTNTSDAPVVWRAVVWRAVARAAFAWRRTTSEPEQEAPPLAFGP